MPVVLACVRCVLPFSPALKAADSEGLPFPFGAADVFEEDAEEEEEASDPLSAGFASPLNFRSKLCAPPTAAKLTCSSSSTAFPPKALVFSASETVFPFWI